MSLDALASISRAEENARQIRNNAAAEAKKQLRQAELAGQEAVQAARDKAEAELTELRRKADEKAKADAVQLAENTENKKAALRARAESRLDQAAMLIVERIVNG